MSYMNPTYIASKLLTARHFLIIPAYGRMINPHRILMYDKTVRRSKIFNRFQTVYTDPHLPLIGVLQTEELGAGGRRLQNSQKCVSSTHITLNRKISNVFLNKNEIDSPSQVNKTKK